MRPGLLAVPVALALLAGCGTDPADAVRRDVRALTEAANEGDADAVRDRADALLATVAQQREAEELTAEQADELLALAQSVRTSADVIDADLLEQRRVEAEVAATAKQLERAKQQLAEERRKAEEAARKADEAAREADEKGKGKGKDDEKDD